QQAGFRTAFVYRIHGHALRGSLYPPRTTLYRVASGRYENEGHGHRVRIAGAVTDLRGAFYHADRKPLGRWFGSQIKYAAREAEHLLTMPRQQMTRVEKLRLMAWPAPIVVFLY